MSQTELRDRIFSGEILHFPQLPAIQKLGDIARQICESTLAESMFTESTLTKSTKGHSTPTLSHQTDNYSEWLKAIYQYQLAAQASTHCKQAFSEALQSIGLNLDDTFCDRFIFRVVPPKNDNAEGAHSWVDVHRDTWGAGIYQQLNWWAPLYAYDASSGIEFYPDYFNKPIANTTAKWQYERFVNARKEQSAELKPTLKSIPSLLEKPTGTVFRPVIEPGDLLCFSAAHLHGSATNISGQSRFSYETRTVNLEDIRSGDKAPNVDNDSSAQLLKLFKNLSDGSPLTRAYFDSANVEAL